MISTLSQLISRAESGNNLYAVRFEPAFTPSQLAIENCARYNNCTQATAKAICAMSFGLYQIMGEELYRRGILKGPVTLYANSAEAQLSAFNTLISEKGINYTLQQVLTVPACRENFAHHYNGNADAYGTYLLATYQKYKGI